LLLYPTAGLSFEDFIIEEVIRGFQCTMKAGIDFHFYRTKDKSEIDLIVSGSFGVIPIEIKLGYKINQRLLTSLKTFINDTGARFGILVNNAERIEILSDNIIQISARYL
ncbi:MAG: DUF4143 domain-containing protein, partial [Desulfobacterales bacterium]|nr:DUF4143 domain-containing protein [Desulfobacterales bacterium]